MLPPKAINALVDIKKSLLARGSENGPGSRSNEIVTGARAEVATSGPGIASPVKEKKQPQTFRGRRAKVSAVQRSFHRRDWWVPSY
jgi:hypothetical protein